MKIWDITSKLDENTPVYEGDPKFSVETRRTIQDDGYMVSKLRMGTHAGTHIDAPSHFIIGGKTVYELPLSSTVGTCQVIDDWDEYTEGVEKVLITGRKGNGRLTEKLAEKLVNDRVRLIGTNMMSIGDDAVHKVLLGSECVILEKLRLDKVPCGEYMLIAAPLKIEADGSPIRAMLIEKDQR